MFSGFRYTIITTSLLATTSLLIGTSLAQTTNNSQASNSNQSVIFQGNTAPNQAAYSRLPSPVESVIAKFDAENDSNKIAVVVNGIPVTNYDIKNRVHLLHLKGYNKTDIVKYATENLIDDTIKNAEISKQKIKVPEETINQAFNELSNGNGMTANQFKDIIEHSGVDFQHFVDSMNTDIGWSILTNRYIQSKERLDPATASLKAAKAGHDLPKSLQYRLKAISLFVPAGNINTAYNTRIKELQDIKQSFSNCNNLAQLTAKYKDVIVTDLGLRYAEDLPADLQTLVKSTPAGSMSNIMQTPNGPEALIVCSAKEVTNDNIINFTYSMQNLANITQEKYLKLQDEYFTKLKKDATVTYIK